MRPIALQYPAVGARLDPLNNPMESNRRVDKKEIQTYAQHEE